MSEHFTYNELDVENYPSLQPKADWIFNNILEPIREYFGMPVNIHDGYRNEAHNQSVGGKPQSFHLWDDDCWAFDFDISGHSLPFVFDTIRLGGINGQGQNFNNSKIDKIILELNPETKTPRCVHIQGFLDISKARHLAYKGYTGACTKYEPVEFRLNTT